MEDKVYLGSLFVQVHLGAITMLSLVIRLLFSSCYGKQGTHLHKRDLCFAFRHIGRSQRAHPVSAFSQLPLTQNNPYARVAHALCL